MKSLILKDLINLKGQFRIYLFLIVFYVGFSLFQQSTSFISGMLIIISTLLVITTVSYDEKNNWNRFELCMPISRKTVVLEKYFMALILIGGSFLISLIFSVSMSGIFNEDLKTVVLSNLFLLGLGLFVISIVLPFIFKFGVEKGRLIMMAVICVPILIIMIVDSLGLSLQSEKNLLYYLYIGVPLFCMLLCAVSIIISLKIYSKREF